MPSSAGCSRGGPRGCPVRWHSCRTARPCCCSRWGGSWIRRCWRSANASSRACPAWSRRCHELGYLHRDIRPNNLMLVGSVVYILDWGFACGVAEAEPAEHEGTIKYASDRVLLHLQADQQFIFQPADDLESLVKSLFSLRHVQDTLLPLIATAKEDIEAIRGLWMRCLDGRPTWTSAMQAAARCDCEKVATVLAMLLA
ncbi:hypothetical protein TSOC_013076 [Tetrabaena socialis]|uniref:Protein kinase domain-containing protein n=1 Tax=Tetrabaena socialis TaxID=47790 RepID=A0A2J7ZLC4_9CHLO|nr:hypothetical protein TSOC_013076 [Tetrabaena socialis]|eukprot:PNH01064.1 hypothetical protein TSOC_013076 [Tetrabaena socialis]